MRWIGGRKWQKTIQIGQKLVSFEAFIRQISTNVLQK
jgi:hypothetical protein